MLKYILQISAVVSAVTNIAGMLIFSGGHFSDEGRQLAISWNNTISAISHATFFIGFAIWIGRQKR